MTVSSVLRQTVILALLFSVGCGTDPSNVTFGETTLVVLVNPVVNTANGIAVPPPGAMQNAVTVGVEQDKPRRRRFSELGVRDSPVEVGVRRGDRLGSIEQAEAPGAFQPYVRSLNDGGTLLSAAGIL